MFSKAAGNISFPGTSAFPGKISPGTLGLRRISLLLRGEISWELKSPGSDLLGAHVSGELRSPGRDLLGA